MYKIYKIYKYIYIKYTKYMICIVFAVASKQIYYFYLFLALLFSAGTFRRLRTSTQKKIFNGEGTHKQGGVFAALQ